jgi:hypothetical protein
MCYAPSGPYPCSVNYTVATGDTCRSIMQAAGLPLRLLHFFNAQVGDNCENLMEGEQLCLLYRPGCSQGYTVSVSDSCTSIIAAHPSLTQELLLLLNPLLDCGSMVVGQVICIMPGE